MTASQSYRTKNSTNIKSSIHFRLLHIFFDLAPNVATENNNRLTYNQSNTIWGALSGLESFMYQLQSRPIEVK